VKQEVFSNENHAEICDSVLSNDGKDSCSRKQREPLVGLVLITDRLRVRPLRLAAPHLVIYLQNCRTQQNDHIP